MVVVMVAYDGYAMTIVMALCYEVMVVVTMVTNFII